MKAAPVSDSSTGSVVGRPGRKLGCAIAGALLVLAATNVAEAAPRWRTAQVSRTMLRSYAVEPLANDSLRVSEKAFLEKAAASTREGAGLAKLATSQAGSVEVRSLAQQLLADYDQMFSAVEGLRQRKGAIPTEPGAPTGDPAASEAQVRLTQKAGAEFDREYVRLVAGLQSDILEIFEKATADSKDADIRELAGSFLPTLRDHGNKVAELRKAYE